MTTIAVIGATGTAGSRVVARLRARDHAVVEISREHRVDVVTGEGLFRALEEVDVAIDVCDPVPADGQCSITRTLATAARNIMGACAAQDVRRLVVSTIAGIDDPLFDGLPYYEGKRAAKEILLDGPVAVTVVKSTHWYESATGPGAVCWAEQEVIVEDRLVQPIAADTAADVLVETALGQAHAPRTITGPNVIRLPELTTKLLAQQGDNRRVRSVQPAVAAFATGAFLAPDGAIVLGPDFDTWLSTMAPAADGVELSPDGEEATTSQGAADELAE